MRTPSLVFVTGIIACSAAPRPGPVHGEVVLSVEGKVEHGPFRFGQPDLVSLPKRTFRARPPAGPPAAFEGVSLATLLTERMELAEGADTIIFRSRDGYVAGVPLVLIKQFKPVLADQADGKPLAEWARSAAVQARPFLVVWPNLEWPGFDSDPRARSWWASDVARVEVARWEQTYGRALRVPPGAGDDARLGAEAYSFHCIACHGIRGAGGEKRPDLTEVMKGREPGQLIERYRAHAFAMGLPANPPRGDEALRQIAYFLRTIQLAGPMPPEEGPKGEEGPEAGRQSGGRPY